MWCLAAAPAAASSVAAKIQRASQAERPIQEAMGAFERLRDARSRVVESRRSLAAAAAQVYREPQRSLRAILADRGAAESLQKGHAHRYGELRGRGGILPPNRERVAALHAVASLTGRLYAHERNVGALHGARLDARELVARIALRPRGLTRGIHGAKAFETAAVLISRGPLQIAGSQTLRRLSPSPATVHRELLRVQSARRQLHLCTDDNYTCASSWGAGRGRLALREEAVFVNRIRDIGPRRRRACAEVWETRVGGSGRRFPSPVGNWEGGCGGGQFSTGRHLPQAARAGARVAPGRGLMSPWPRPRHCG
jgi:hypothetical protein